MIFALCATCHRVVVSYEVESLIEGLPSFVEWVHYVRDEEHFAVPCRSIRERVLYCAVCRRRQVLSYGGWVCGNEHCPSRVDKD